MKSLVRLSGSVLMVLGVALLVYVGVAYVHGLTSTPKAAATWSRADQKQAKEIAAATASQQRINLPKSLKGHLPPAGSEPAVRIVIPNIRVDAPVVQTPPVNGVWAVADWAVGHLTTSPNPGTVGNVALSAHDDIKGEIFKRLGELKPGDTVELYTGHTVYTYVVINQQVVDPSDVQVLNPTTRPIVTLISCSPYWVDTQRLVVQALLKSRAAA